MTTLQRPPRTLGPGHDEFWAGCAAGELRLPRQNGGALQWPIPSATAGDSFDLRWETLSGRGTLESWCSFHQDYYKGLIPVPYDTILVRLEEGPLFISNPHGFDRADMRAGIPLSVTFVDAEDAAGTYRLPVFERVG